MLVGVLLFTEMIWSWYKDSMIVSQNIIKVMLDIGNKAKRASRTLANVSASQKNYALISAAEMLREKVKSILGENSQDLIAARKKGLSPAMQDRLKLDNIRVEAIATSLEEIAKLPDPVGRTLANWQRPNGLDISRKSVPLGVIGVIFESRPNVTADAGALCLKASNASILRCGSDSFLSSNAIFDCLKGGLKKAGLPEDAIQFVPSTDREAVGQMLKMSDTIDIIIPRGGRSLVDRVKRESRIPIFAHLEGICHLYIDVEADPRKALDLVLNSKLRRTGICGACETLLIDKAAIKIAPTLLNNLIKNGCEIRGDKELCAMDKRVIEANVADWDTEYLAAILSVKFVNGVQGAIDHIQNHSSGHTDSIVTENITTAEIFLNNVDSAIVMHNTSTQFADGNEFGMGAEIGISTGRIHARGPVGLEQLTIFKYIVRGNGQTRP